MSAIIRLKRKSFGIGALFGAKNWKAAASGVKEISKLDASGNKIVTGVQNLNKKQRLWEGAKGTLKSVGTVAGTAAVGVGIPFAVGKYNQWTGHPY